MKDYETTFIVDAHLQDDVIEKTVDKFLKFIENNGGKLGLVDRWGKRRLAYEIRKKQYGFYVCVRYGAEGTFIQSLEREFQLDENILRSLTILVHKSVLKEEQEKPGEGARKSPVAEDDETGSTDTDGPDSAGKEQKEEAAGDVETEEPGESGDESAEEQEPAAEEEKTE
ncbi:30S ribosomal protein S6 [bacterium]|nr:30S ribosomal protein S6 [bacterium]